MAANDFSKEERVAFDNLMEGFEDALVISRHVTYKKLAPQMAERTGDQMWFPQPYILPSYTGVDQTGNFHAVAQRVVPMVIDQEICVPFTLSPTELRDALQEGRLSDAAKQRLASDVNTAIMNKIVKQATIVTTKSTAAAGFADVAAIEAVYNRLGIAMDARYIAFPTVDYNGLAADLAGRQDIGSKPAQEAYKRAYVGMIAGFDTYKLDNGPQLTASGITGVTMDTRATASNYYVPKAKVATANGMNNVDNRYQQITVTDATVFAVGDAFTIAGVNEVHHITKSSTGNLKPFRVISVDDATHITISPPIVSAQGGTVPEIQYQNVSVSASATATITPLNTVTKNVGVHWHRDAIVVVPGTYEIPNDQGVKTMKSSTEQGVQVSITKWTEGRNLQTFFRLDVRFGVNIAQPEMCGIHLFSQT